MNISEKNQEIIRAAIVEDDDQIRAMFIQLLESAVGFRCVSGYPNAEEALKDIPTKNPDIVLMDINLPGMDGIDCVKKLKLSIPDCSVVMLTVYEDSDHIFESLKAGAVGYLLKSTSGEKILDALKEAQAGGAPMSVQIARKVVQFFHSTKPLSDPKKEEELTEREAEILSLLSKGYMYKEIASDLFISMDTVKTHISKIYTKLHVRSKTEAVIKYLKR